MLKLSKFKIILGITTFTTVATLPFLILSINEKTVENHKNISDITFSKVLKSQSLEVISALRQKNAESFSSTNENTEAQIKDFSKFEKDFQDFIDEVSQNPNLNLEKLAKEKLLKKGVTADNIEKIFASKNSKNSKNDKIQNQDLLVKPQSFSSKSSPNLKMKEFADKLLHEHILTATLAAVNYGLAVAYGVIWMWGSAFASTIAGGILTWLSVEYKNAYNSLVYDKNWNAIKGIYLPDLLSRVSSYVGLGLTGREIWKQMGRLRKVQVAATAALKPVRWVNPKIVIVLATIDLFQTIISLG